MCLHQLPTENIAVYIGLTSQILIQMEMLFSLNLKRSYMVMEDYIQWNPLISRPFTSRFPVISRVVLWTDFVPSLYVLKKGLTSRLYYLKIPFTSRV